MFDWTILMDDYNTGKRAFTRYNLMRDIIMFGGLSENHAYLILQDVVNYAKGDKDYELGRLLKHRDRIIRAKLN